MASLYTRGKVIWIKYKLPNGKRVRESLNLLDNARGRKLASYKLTEKQYFEKFGTAPPVHTSLSISQAIKELQNSKVGLAQSSIDQYSYNIQPFIDYAGDLIVNKVTPEIVNEYTKHLKANKAHNTVAAYLDYLSMLFDYLIAHKWVETNPVTTLKKIEMPIRVIPEETFNKILNACQEHQKVYLTVLWNTGLRKVEAANLRGENFDFKNNILNVWNQKENRWDQIPLSENFVNYIQPKIKEGRLFNMYNTRNSFKFWWKWQDRLELQEKYSLHDIRRTFGTRMAKKLSPYELQKVMRHKSIKTTMKYYIYVELNDIGRKM